MSQLAHIDLDLESLVTNDEDDDKISLSDFNLDDEQGVAFEDSPINSGSQMILTDCQTKAFNLFKGGKSLCITGPGGCGKSYLINLIRNYCKDHNINIAVTSSTGCSACLVNGITVHSWSGIRTGEHSVDKILSYVRKIPKYSHNWRKTEVLIIDEISMLSGEIFDKLDGLARQIRNSNKFFGGIQLVTCGDFAQLPPVKHNKLIFELPEWQRHMAGNTVYLREIIRQKDKKMTQLLNEIRMGTLSHSSRELIKSRIFPKGEIQKIYRSKIVKPTLLFPYRTDVDLINSKRLNKLVKSGETNMTFNALNYKMRTKGNGSQLPLTETEHAFVERNTRAKDKLVVTTKTQVMLNVNLDLERGLANGTRGVVMKFVNGLPLVRFDNGIEEIVPLHEFRMDTTDYIYYRKQLPLELAWAITIHKSQGCTLEEVITNLSGAFCDGQIYVTMSRVRSLEGLYLEDIDFDRITCDSRVKTYYESLE